jgi:hypothetical protein
MSKPLPKQLGDIDNLLTSYKDDLVGAINENVSNLINIIINVKYPPNSLLPAKGDGNTNDIGALNAIARYCETNGYAMKIPSGTYNISETFIPPTNVECYGDGLQKTFINATFTSGDICSCDADGQQVYNIHDIRFTCTNQDSNTLNGFRVGSCRNSTFKSILSFGTWGAGIIVESINTNGHDIDNPTFEHCWTVKTGGIILRTNTTTSYGNITDMHWHDCILQTDDNTTYIAPYTVITIQACTGKSIFGVKFDRCFAQARYAPILSIDKNGGTIYNCNFDTISCDYWGQGGITDVTPDINPVILNGVFLCTFKNVMTAQYHAGWKITACHDNIFDSASFNTYTGNSNSRFFDIDSTSHDNHIIKPFFNQGNYLELASGTICHSPNNIFGDTDLGTGEKIIFNDKGYGNTIEGSIITNLVKLANSPSKLFSVTGSQLTNYPAVFNKNGTTVTLSGGYLRITLGTTKDDYNIPISLKQKYNCIHMRYKVITTGFTGSITTKLWGMGGKQLIADGIVHEMIVVTDSTVHPEAPYYTLSVSTALSNNVTVEIQKWEIIEGYNIPYIPNYVAIESQGN